MSAINDNEAWKLGVQQLLRRMIADLYHSADQAQFQRQLDALLRTTLEDIETNVQFPGVDEATVNEVKEKASAVVRRVVGTIKPA